MYQLRIKRANCQKLFFVVKDKKFAIITATILLMEVNGLRQIFTLITLLLIIFPTVKVAADSPPTDYAVWDRMPAEAEVQGFEKAKLEINLYSAPRSSNVVGTLQADEVVKRISCVVYGNPAAHPVKVLHTFKAQSKPYGDKDLTLYSGEYVYLIMYTGEGTFLGWYKGKQVWWLDWWVNNFHSKNSADSWGQYEGMPVESNLAVEVWNCYRKRDGTTGWVLIQDKGKSLNKFGRTGIFTDEQWMNTYQSE